MVDPWARRRWERLAAVGAGAAATLAFLDALAVVLFALWTESLSRTPDPECQPITIGDCMSPRDAARFALVAVVIVVGVGAVIGLALIAAVVAVVGGVSRWWPRRGSGTVVAVALGAAGSVIGPGCGVLVLGVLIAGRVTT
ncbi:hypothetical protein WEI85_40440 [Actinomycetes bacterium KLBMP 9797]